MSSWWERFEGSSGLLGLFAELMVARDHQALNEWVVSLLRLQPADRILEIDFGPGYVIRKLSRIVKNGFVAGITPSEALWRHAGRRNRVAIQAGKVELRMGTPRALPYPDATFDKAFSIDAIEFWLDQTYDLKEIERVVKKGGQIVVAWHRQSSDEKNFSKPDRAGQDVAANLEKAGWTQVRFIEKPTSMEGVVCVIGIKP